MHVYGRAPIINAVSVDVLRLVVAEVVYRARLEAVGRTDEVVPAMRVTKAELSGHKETGNGKVRPPVERTGCR